MKTILIISPEFPYPPTQGSKLDIWGHINFFHKIGWRIVLVVCGPETSSVELPVDIDLHFVHRCSHYLWPKAENPATIAKVQKLIDSYKPQVVWIEYAHFASLVSALTLHGAKLWFRSHNFELAQAVDKMLSSPPWLTGHINKKSLVWIKNFFRLPHIFSTEQLMHRIADRIFFISCRDLNLMSKLYRGSVAKDWVLPFLECELIPIKDGKTPLDIVHVGNYMHKPNLAGVRMLLHELVPAIEASMPGAFQFHVVGRGSREQFGQYASKTVIIHDFIEDLSAFLNSMDIACLPLKFGWGCKIKMIEALASGLPVVGAHQTFRGVPLTQGAYYACNTIQDYVEALKQLQDSETRRHIALAGQAAYTTWLNEGQRILHTTLKDIEDSTSATSLSCE